MRLPGWFALATVLSLAGCEIDQEDFPSIYADAACDKMRKCDKASYESSYEDDAECESQQEDFAAQVVDIGDALGEYDPEHARDCIDAIRAATCEEWGNGDYGGNCDAGYLF
jgi:hypothetical protein